MADFTNRPKSASTFANRTKNDSRFLTYLRHRKEGAVEQIAERTFEDIAFQDGTKVQDVEFPQFLDKEWSNQPKN